MMLLASLMVHGQTDYGILIKSTIKSKNPSASSTRYTICGVTDYSSTGPSGSIDLYNKRFCTNNIIPLNTAEKIQYDFFYTRDIDGIFILDAEINSRNQSICTKEYAIPYNKNTFTEETLGGCAGRSNVWSIHLKQPTNNKVCPDQTINLSNGWNWQYKYDSNNWEPLPAQFQGKRSISFKLKDIGGYDNKSQIFFQAGYQTQFTNTVTYDIISCSPNLVSTSDNNITDCSYSNGSVTFTFSRPLDTGEKFRFNRNLLGSGHITEETSDGPNVEKISNLSYKWKNIPPGQYEFKYQTQFGSDIPSSLSAVSQFTITARTALTFTARAVEPQCSTDKGGILVSASGGTGTYFYLLDGEPLSQKHAFTSPYTIPITTDGDHNVIVIDSFDCIEK